MLDQINDEIDQFTADGAQDGNPSTGLGLAISRSLAQAMGGRLLVASVEGTGSTFELRLPSGPRRAPE